MRQLDLDAVSLFIRRIQLIAAEVAHSDSSRRPLMRRLPIESHCRRVLSCLQRGPRCTSISHVLCSRCQPQNAGRGPVHGASVLDATFVYCPSAPDLVSSAAISSGPPKALALSRRRRSSAKLKRSFPQGPRLRTIWRRTKKSEETRDE